MPEKVLDITIDVDSLTFGEMMAAEDASGKDITQLLSRAAHQRVLMLFVHRLRTSGKPPDWQQLASLTVRDALPSTSGSSPAGDSRE
jgi:hypothetical protein